MPPTWPPAIVDLLRESDRPGGRGFAGIHHVVNAGRASRAEWAREVLRLAGIDVPTEDVPMTTWPRPSKPPAWGVLDPTPLPKGLLAACGKKQRVSLVAMMDAPKLRAAAGLCAAISLTIRSRSWRKVSLKITLKSIR